jgi:hypothetical protein
MAELADPPPPDDCGTKTVDGYPCHVCFGDQACVDPNFTYCVNGGCGDPRCLPPAPKRK